ncbi:hypothetical protein BD324DRAFT_614520 [Kockovaella imperatae]|uniref:Uncharacterized protein n=1 Tax=Kockovaella imperatae TaxID=4999 RepID=A0A1Y1UNR4_9TREE|nr:hypothetical protein BD324DRAFT_614520 [Kockovaella imperatae]ORX39659.1 hypothetical protein BD324DRAFT_614520 [Kockovaella imperatae]
MGGDTLFTPGLGIQKSRDASKRLSLKEMSSLKSCRSSLMWLLIPKPCSSSKDLSQCLSCRC